MHYDLLILLMRGEQKNEREKMAAQWKDQVFLHNPKMYKAVYMEQPEVQDHDVQWKVPTTIGEVAEVLNDLQKAGGPNLDFTYDDDDWSFVDKFKKNEEPTDSTESHTHDSGSSVDAFDALHTQDIDE